MIALAPPLRGPLGVTPHGYYGATRPLRNGVHHGLAFQAVLHEDVIAAAAGQVARVNFDKPVSQGGGGGGNYVITRHTDGDGKVFELGYMHLQVQYVRPGDRVEVGQVLGSAGATGTADGGVHLHFQVNQIAGSTKLPIDPTSLLPLDGGGKPASSSGGGGLALAALALLGTLLRRWL